MKFAADRPYDDPEKAARKPVENANAVDPVQDGRIFIELINWPSTRPASIWRLHAAGSGCMNPGPT
jgi:hypothetical protein